MLSDSHLHLQDVPFPLARQIVDEASAHHVGRFFCNATSPEDWGAVSGFAQPYPSIVSFFGIHPWYVDGVEEGWEESLEKYLHENPNSGVGEIGLDRGKKAGDYEKQKTVFSSELQVAVRLRRPFIIHGVHAWDDIFTMLEASGARSVPFIVHGFSDAPEIAQRILDLGGMISVSMRLLEGKHRKVIRTVPLEKIMIETDFPYHRRENRDLPLTAEEYFFVLHQTYQQTAQAAGADPDRLVAAVWDNGTIFAH